MVFFLPARSALKPHSLVFPLLFALFLAAAGGCSKPPTEATAATRPAKHEHKAPHGGTPVVLGNEAYHLELVRDAVAGKLQAYVLDGEMENFIRSTAPAFEIVATVNGSPRTLVLQAVSNSLTGETVGDTSLFETQADWLKTTAEFDGLLKSLAIRGSTFGNVTFNFPKGNDRD